MIRTIPHSARTRGGIVLALLCTAALAVGAGAEVTNGLFTDGAVIGGNGFSTKHIFEGSRTTTAFTVSDVSSGSAVDSSDTMAYAADARSLTTKSWASSFAAGRYFEVEESAPLPSGLTVSSPSFLLDVASSVGTDTTCFYFEVRRTSDNALLGTHGSSGSPVGCVTSTSFTSSSTGIPEVTTTDAANDLSIRVFVKNSGSASAVIDRATVTGSTPHSSFTLYSVASTDAADTIPVRTQWPLQ